MQSKEHWEQVTARTMVLSACTGNTAKHVLELRPQS